MKDQKVFFLLDKVENGSRLKIQTAGPGHAVYPEMREYVYHSLAEAMREINNSLSGFDMTPVYRAPRSLDCVEMIKMEGC